MIELENVGIELGGKSVLEAVSMTVSEGEFLAVVGPNGAGKTTLLRTCNGLLTPNSGTVRLDGTDVTALSARSLGRLVATVPQGTQLAFDFDVRDAVAMGRTPHRSRFATATETDRNAVVSALERTETAAFADRSVGDLSGGERQRVVFARALAQETPVLLLDEPTASLDINHQVGTLSMARELTTEGKTVVAAIHDLELAARFCDRLALVAGGELVSIGKPETVLTAGRLETAFDVRTAVGTNPITGTATVTPLSDDPPTDRRIHVLGGGRSAARLLGRLAEAGIEVTAGVLSENDIAAVTAGELASSVVTAPAFEPIGETQRAAVRTLVEKADATVVSGPLDREHIRLARHADRLFASDTVPDPPSNARVVPDAELLSVLESGETVESSASSQ